MEIKTVVMPRCIGAKKFDKQVNDALKEGFKLTRRDVIPGHDDGSTRLEPAYYAELVKLDEPARKDDTPNVFELLEAVSKFCASKPNCDGCPLKEFCEAHLADNEGPADWDIYEAERASQE